MTELAVVAGRGEAAVARLPLLRRAMVRQMVLGAAVPCFYLRVSADLTELIAVRRELKAARAQTAAEPQAAADAEAVTEVGAVPSVNDFVVRAVALELRAHPAVNSSFAEEQIATHPRVNVGVAVAVPGGLVVPAVYDADRLDLYAIAAAVRELSELAARRKLGREVLSDATFTVSNLGMYGIEDFDPILNPPQAAILAVGEAAADHAGRLRVRLTLGCDHRALTGAEAAPFLTGVRDRLQDPRALLEPPSTEQEQFE
jgi:pyruvate dehydrogenase E2 component (dihydrolipoamide acetyltransferase)